MNISEKFRSIVRERSNLLNSYNYASLTLAGDIPEEKIPSPIPFIKTDKQNTLWDILRILSYIRRSELKGVLLTIKPLSVGYARANSLRKAINSIVESGKHVYVHLENPGNMEYYIASASGYISLSPMSALNFTGISSEVFFFRDLLDKYGIEPEIFGIGEYKSATETFTRSSMSESNREMIKSILDDQFDRIIEEIAVGRKIDKKKILEYLDNAPFSSATALDYGFIDNVGYEDELHELVREKEQTDIRTVNTDKLVKLAGYSRKLHGIVSILRGDKFNVALVTIDGMITQGKSRSGSGGLKTAGSDTIINTLEKVRTDKSVKAAIIRIMSPGGSAVASDIIRKKIELISREKPVYISMSDIAASGGYMVSLSGIKLFSDPFTLTGSIGVVAGKINLKKLLTTLGINSETITRGKMSSMYSITRGFTDSERKHFIGLLKTMYNDFVNMVSRSRDMTVDQVERSARGRVWTGSQAQELGLVDELGDLGDTVSYVFRELAITDNIENRIKVFSHENRLSVENLGKYFGISLQSLKEIMPDGEYIFSVMPFWIRIR